jgi:SOS-response transcriptional repressor LexA
MSAAQRKTVSVMDPVLGLTMYPALTDRQLAMVRWIHEYAVRERQYPTQREVAAGLGYSQAAAGHHIQALVKKGYLAMLPRTEVSRRNMRMTQLAVEKLRLSEPQLNLNLDR